MSPEVAQRATDRVMEYPFKVWGFGEEIALNALLEYGRVTGDWAPGRFVERLVEGWCRRVDNLGPADHVAPGATIVELHALTGDEVYARTAQTLGELYRRFEEVDGIPVHRPDLPHLGVLIWVDCMALDGPFLARLASLTGNGSWLELALTCVSAYADALFDEDAALFRHGYDVLAKRKSECNWARGNGWAMHGLVDFLAALPLDHPARNRFEHLLFKQVSAVLDSQHESGLWHTVLDDPTTPLENSTGALFASALLKARRLSLIPGIEQDYLLAAMTRAIAALADVTSDDGGLQVSYAAPVGGRRTYADAPLGVFPWGQGPLLLAFCETRHAEDGSSMDGLTLQTRGEEQR